MWTRVQQPARKEPLELSAVTLLNITVSPAAAVVQNAYGTIGLGRGQLDPTQYTARSALSDSVAMQTVVLCVLQELRMPPWRRHECELVEPAATQWGC